MWRTRAVATSAPAVVRPPDPDGQLVTGALTLRSDRHGVSKLERLDLRIVRIHLIVQRLQATEDGAPDRALVLGEYSGRSGELSARWRVTVRVRHRHALRQRQGVLNDVPRLPTLRRSVHLIERKVTRRERVDLGDDELTALTLVPGDLTRHDADTIDVRDDVGRAGEDRLRDLVWRQ